MSRDMDAHETIHPDSRFCNHPLCRGDFIPAPAPEIVPQPGWFERRAWLIVGLLFGVVAAGCGAMAVIAQPTPCDRSGVKAATEPPLAVLVNRPDADAARNNREIIEQALRSGGTATLPAGLVAVDRAIRLPSGCTLAGAGPATILRNTQTGAPFGDNCSLVVHPQVHGDVGIGYADGFTRGKNTRITFADAAVANRYNVGGWLFTFAWNGYTTPGGSQTWVHRIESKTGNTLALNVEPQPGANAAVYTRSAVRVSGALEGSSKLKVGAGSLEGFAPGKLLYVTAGPVKGNECCGEVRRLMVVAPDGLTLDRPLRSTYPYALALAVLLSPVEGVTVRDLTLGLPVNASVPPFYAKYAMGLTLQRVVSDGNLDFGQCTGLLVSDCTAAASIKLNGCRDSLVTGSRCKDVYLEEMNSDCAFANVLVSGSQTAGINAVAGSPSERITLRDCVVEAARDMPIHLIGRECVVDNCVVRNSNNPVPWVNVYLGGDGTRVNNLRSDLPIVFRSGRGLSLSRVLTPCYLGWRDPGDQPTGVTVACPAVDTNYLTPATLAQWTISSTATE